MGEETNCMQNVITLEGVRFQGIEAGKVLVEQEIAQPP